MEVYKTNQQYSIGVIGAGHVGLVAAACFAELGYKVICVDNDRAKINSLNKNILPFYEPELEPLVIKNVKSCNLKFSNSLDQGIRKSQVIFIAVGTPPREDGSADLTAIENVAHKIAKNLNSYKLIVEKSTVPVQTGKKLKDTIYRYRENNEDFDVASNPEFLREGKGVYDFFNPDRIVIGVESERAEKILKDIYSTLKATFVVTDINTAELIKHASNSYLATKISFINAVARICDATGSDVKKVSQAMGLDTRIGKEFLAAGIGYGGFCFPKDVEAFLYISKKLGSEFSLLKEVKNINDEQPLYFAEKIKEHLWVLKEKKVAVLGLSFKPETDDMRFAPSIGIINFLIKEGSNIILYDSVANSAAREIFKNKRIKFAQSAYEAVKNCDCACFLTEWKELKELDFKRIKKDMRYPFVADGRNMFDREKLLSMGFHYVGVGR